MNPKGSPEEFDEATYLELNPDVEAAVFRGEFESGEAHYRAHGYAENRLCSLGQIRGQFPSDWDEAEYLRHNPDVVAVIRAGVLSSGYEHWLLHGSEEGRLGGSVPIHREDPAQAVAARPIGCNYFGFQAEAIGLGAAARQYLELLGESSTPVVSAEIPWGDANWALSAAACAPQKTPYAMNVLHMNPDVLPLFLRHYGAAYLSGRINIGYWAWELHAGYASWNRFTRLFHEIWAPSRFVTDALRTISSAPLAVVPHVVDGLPEVPEVNRAGFGWKPEEFVFLYVFDVASSIQRKNPAALIRAFRRTFGKRDDVRLVLKFHHSNYDSTGPAALARMAEGAPNIQIIEGTLPSGHVQSMLLLCDCFVSPHRSEGFGLSIASAMYYGKPVIATAYGGNVDFTTPETSYLIDFDLLSLDADVGAYQKGYVWADPSERHLARLMCDVFNNREEAARRAHNGRKLVRRQFSREAIRKCLFERLEHWMQPAR